MEGFPVKKKNVTSFYKRIIEGGEYGLTHRKIIKNLLYFETKTISMLIFSDASKIGLKIVDCGLGAKSFAILLIPCL